jgi:amino-acid N-acetyltransferase
LEIPQVFALTRKPGFFLNLGFHRVEREQLPRKIWKDCIHCTKFTGCDEVAMVRAVTPAASAFEPGIVLVPHISAIAS